MHGGKGDPPKEGVGEMHGGKGDPPKEGVGEMHGGKGDPPPQRKGLGRCMEGKETHPKGRGWGDACTHCVNVHSRLPVKRLGECGSAAVTTTCWLQWAHAHTV